MRKMLQLKAAAEAAAAAKTRGPAQQGQPLPPPQHGDSRRQHTQAAAGQQQHASSNQDGTAATQLPAVLTAGRKLKASKKKFLASKKAKKKGKLHGLDAALGEKEAALATAAAASKPAFGEQAAQPLRVHLKRKHWVEDPQAATAKRCTAIFKQQMAAARAAAGTPSVEAESNRGQGTAKKATKQQQATDEQLRMQLIEAYRQQKHAQVGAQYGAATAATLAALVSKAVE